MFLQACALVYCPPSLEVWVGDIVACEMSLCEQQLTYFVMWQWTVKATLHVQSAPRQARPVNFECINDCPCYMSHGKSNLNYNVAYRPAHVYHSVISIVCSHCGIDPHSQLISKPYYNSKYTCHIGLPVIMSALQIQCVSLVSQMNTKPTLSSCLRHW